MRERQFRQRKHPDSYTTALWQSYHQSSVRKQEKWAKGMRICPCKAFYSYLQLTFFYLPYNSTAWGLRLTSLPKEAVLKIFIALIARNLASNCKDDNHYTPMTHYACVQDAIKPLLLPGYPMNH
jgi:hypothetical protein